MNTIQFLKPGDTIGVCAPSACFDIDTFKDGVQVLQDLGFNIKIPEQIFQRKRYLAGDDIIRARVIMQLFADPEVDAIISARGGFGALRILDYMDWSLMAGCPKPFIGFSDTTALLLAMIDRCDMPVIHGPNLISLACAQNETIDSFYQTLTGDDCLKIRLKEEVICPGNATGILKGGNLSTISHLVGTGFQPDFNQCIFFMEDIHEPAYKIDRMLMQMKMAGLFDGITGVVTGSFTACENETYIPQILTEIFQDFNIPVLGGLDAGHGSINLSLVMGTMVQVSSEDLMLSKGISQ
ncbi:MAG: LD-carboxypeptidase [Proteobacteria bacterium]|nr:LD-carboxypeptidase [Pseudomonadota bacterium]MBU1386300.1 LD-carboxypeptidase [Pseudomonadota bacterium]MBU1543952.1 LD-carboxypeptidase [Pseudomonadota bacterium]MBU2482251.1 LD-carboxypeptidase [Pseudomonadota bacterium]